MSDARKISILVIDDDITQRMLVKEYLEQAGYLVRQSEDGQHGLRMASKIPVDVILLDYVLPSMDGLAVCAALRRNASTINTPIILMTASKDSDVVTRGLAAGATDFITKPVEWQFLADRIGHVLSRSERLNELSATKERLEDALRESQSGASTRLDEEREALRSQAEKRIAAAIAASEASQRRLQRHFEEQTRQIQAEADARVLEAQSKVHAFGNIPGPAAQSHQPDAGFWNFAAAMSTEQFGMVRTILEQAWQIAGPSRALSDPTLTAALRSLDSECQTLANSLNNFNMLASQLSGALVCEPQPVDLAAELDAAAAGLEAQRSVKNLSVIVNIQPGFKLVADQHKLRRLLSHLLNNAARFSLPGGTIMIDAGQQDDGSAVIQITDQGVGMAPAVLAKVRNSIDHPANMLTRADNQVGFGIPLATAFARLHGGVIEFDSVVGTGTTVSVVLPRDCVANSQARIQQSAGHRR